jgi:hypothetical protein
MCQLGIAKIELISSGEGEEGRREGCVVSAAVLRQDGHQVVQCGAHPDPEAFREFLLCSETVRADIPLIEIVGMNDLVQRYGCQSSFLCTRMSDNRSFRQLPYDASKTQHRDLWRTIIPFVRVASISKLWNTVA